MCFPFPGLSRGFQINPQHSDRLQGEWGVSDVRDCILAAQRLSTSLNLIDPSRIFIRGGSSGGYTVLVAISHPPLDTPPEFKWTGATSLYGVSDLKRLEEDTHKFESKYLNGLIGGSYEEVPEVYKERSPISHVDKINTPLLVSLAVPAFDSFWEVLTVWCRSSRDRKMLSFRLHKPSLSYIRWRKGERRSSIFCLRVRGTGGGRLRISRRDSRRS